MTEAARTAALATGLIHHSQRCTMSKLGTCICLYDARLEHLAKAFDKFAEERDLEMRREFASKRDWKEA